MDSQKRHCHLLSQRNRRKEARPQRVPPRKQPGSLSQVACVVPLSSKVALPVALGARSPLLVKAPWKECLEGLVRGLAEPSSHYRREHSRKPGS